MKDKEERNDREFSLTTVISSLTSGVGYAAFHVTGDTTVFSFLVDVLGVSVLFFVISMLVFEMSGRCLVGKKGKSLAASFLKHTVGWCFAAFLFVALLKR